MEKHYQVSWEVDVYAETPQEAAEEAERVQIKQTSEDGLRGVFDVTDEDGKIVRVDLEEGESHEM